MQGFYGKGTGHHLALPPFSYEAHEFYDCLVTVIPKSIVNFDLLAMDEFMDVLVISG